MEIEILNPIISNSQNFIAMSTDDRSIVNHLFSELIKFGEYSTAKLICRSSLVRRGAEIADRPSAIHRIEICPGVCVYTVRSENLRGGWERSEYLVVPGRHCTCPFYTDSVIPRQTDWTCKHDLAVRLRLSSDRESIKPHPLGSSILNEKQFK